VEVEWPPRRRPPKLFSKEASKMRRVKLFLALLLASVCAAGPAHAVASVSLNAASAQRAAAPQASTGSAASERDEGRALLHRGRASEALIHLERALKVFQASNDKSGEASTRDLLGELYERQGRYDSALENYQAAHDLYASGSVGSAKSNISTKAAGKVSRDAGAVVSTGAELSTDESNYNARLMLAKIGNMFYRRGDLTNARAFYARVGSQKPDTSAMGKVKRTKGLLGGFGVGLGSDNRGVQIGAPSLGGLLTIKDQLNFYHQSILYAGQELGFGRLDFKANQFDSARTHFKNVLDATDGDIPFVGKLGQTRRYRTAARTSLGDVALAQGRYEDAAKLYEEALKGAKSDGRLDLMWPAQRGEGRSLWKRADAERDKKKADKLRAEALDSYREALKTVETIREGSIRADESRTTFIATTAEVFEEAAGAFAETAITTANGAAPVTPNGPATTRPLEGKALEYAVEALAIAERGRSRSLLDMLGEAGGEIAGDEVPAELLRQKRANLRRQQEIAAMLTGVSLGGNESRDKLEDAEKELGSLQSDYESIENRIRAASPRYDALTSTRSLTPEEINQQVLDDGTALLEYSLGEERSYLFAVTRAGMTVSRLPSRAEVERQVTTFRSQIIPSTLRRSISDFLADPNDPQRGIKLRTATPPQASPDVVNAYAQAASSLYKSVVEPAAPLFKQSRLLIVADGALNYVPFDALVNAAPPPNADFSTLPYLLKTNETLFAPSASVVAAIRRQRGTSADARRGDMLVVADPVFDASDSRASRPTGAPQSGAQTARAGLSFESALADLSNEGDEASANAGAPRGMLVRLVGTGEEAREIAKLASASGRRADVWVGSEANESNVEEKDLRQYQLLHFATHGLLNAERPQFTGVVLSLVGNREGSDGFLRTDEIFNLRLSSPLVMLSACETGLGREKRGEGVMGLTRAFMYAGAPTVGVTLWSVADKSTSELMTDFYKSLLAANAPTPSASMREARIRMIDGKRYSTPFYWAPFVIVGDWR
jgi:CHAT domain-containing protein/tetratricopeptide (TPR) repeat protein